MKFPELCRNNTYINFDKDGKPEYVVLCNGGKNRCLIEKVIPLKEDLKTVVLPKLVKDVSFYIPIDTNNEAVDYYAKDQASMYAKGTVCIGKDCFEGLDDIKIVVPFRNSLKVDSGAFDRNANVEFVIPEGHSIKSLTREYGSKFKGYDDWTVIADDKLKGSIDWSSGYVPEIYHAKDFNPQTMRFNTITVSKECFEEYEARLDGKKYPPDKKKFDTMSMSEFGEYYAHEHDIQM